MSRPIVDAVFMLEIKLTFCLAVSNVLTQSAARIPDEICPAQQTVVQEKGPGGLRVIDAEDKNYAAYEQTSMFHAKDAKRPVQPALLIHRCEWDGPNA